jgi:hypothetical protein
LVCLYTSFLIAPIEDRLVVESRYLRSVALIILRFERMSDSAV